MKKIKIYTDGSCKGNPGPGGFGAILKYNGYEKEISGGESKTTNNRMELLAIIESLKLLKESCEIFIYSDSQYVCNSINKGWAEKWKANNWMRNRKETALNQDLWEQLLDLLSSHKAKFVWVKGHAGHPENERCDRLAVLAAEKF